MIALKLLPGLTRITHKSCARQEAMRSRIITTRRDMTRLVFVVSRQASIALYTTGPRLSVGRRQTAPRSRRSATALESAQERPGLQYLVDTLC